MHHSFHDMKCQLRMYYIIFLNKAVINNSKIYAKMEEEPLNVKNEVRENKV